MARLHHQRETIPSHECSREHRPRRHTERLQLTDDQVAYLLTPFILAAWDLRSFYVEQIHQHLVDPRTQAACASIAYAPEIALALSEACTSGVDQSVRDVLLEWGTRQIGARAAWDGAQ